MWLDIALQALHGGLCVTPFVLQPIVDLIEICVDNLITGGLYAFLRPKQALQSL